MASDFPVSMILGVDIDINVDLSLLRAQDTAFALISRAPLPKLEAYKARRGWALPWVSSCGSEFKNFSGLEYRGVKLSGLLGLFVEPEERSDVLHGGWPAENRRPAPPPPWGLPLLRFADSNVGRTDRVHLVSALGVNGEPGRGCVGWQLSVTKGRPRVLGVGATFASGSYRSSLLTWSINQSGGLPAQGLRPPPSASHLASTPRSTH